MKKGESYNNLSTCCRRKRAAGLWWAKSARIMSTSATRDLPPEVGAQYTRLEPSAPHSSAAACHGYSSRTPLSAYAWRRTAACLEYTKYY